MATFDPDLLVQIRGDDTLVERLRAPLFGALAGRHEVYVVEVGRIGPGETILVCINGSRGRLPLLFPRDHLEPAHVQQVVRDTVHRLFL